MALITKRDRREYPAILAYAAYMHSTSPGWIKDQIELARSQAAPKDALHPLTAPRSGEQLGTMWVTLWESKPELREKILAEAERIGVADALAEDPDRKALRILGDANLNGDGIQVLIGMIASAAPDVLIDAVRSMQCAADELPEWRTRYFSD